MKLSKTSIVSAGTGGRKGAVVSSLSISKIISDVYAAAHSLVAVNSSQFEGPTAHSPEPVLLTSSHQLVCAFKKLLVAARDQTRQTATFDAPALDNFSTSVGPALQVLYNIQDDDLIRAVVGHCQ